MHASLLHGSAPNTSASPRTLYIATYYAEDAVELLEPALHPHEIAPGAPPHAHGEGAGHLVEVRADDPPAPLGRGDLGHLLLREVAAVRGGVRVGDALQRGEDALAILANREGHRVPRLRRRVVEVLVPPGELPGARVLLRGAEHGDVARGLERGQGDAREAEEGEDGEDQAPRERALMPRHALLHRGVRARDQQEALGRVRAVPRGVGRSRGPGGGGHRDR